MDLVVKAVEFAAKAHSTQVRKYTGEAYFVHCAEVAAMVSETYDCCDEMVAAAYLHDVIEDTNWTFVDLSVKFGNVVAQLVREVTDVSQPEDGNRAKRKAIDRDHFRGASHGAQTIKLADMISNTSSIVERDPKFAKVYMHEKLLLLPYLKEGDDKLFTRARLMIEEYYSTQDCPIEGSDV